MVHLPMYLESVSSSPLFFIVVGGFCGIGNSLPAPESPPLPPLPDGVSLPFLDALPVFALVFPLPALAAFNASSASYNTITIHNHTYKKIYYTLQYYMNNSFQLRLM